MSKMNCDTPEDEMTLRAEIAELRRQLQEQRKLLDHQPQHARKAARPSRLGLTLGAMVAVILIVAGFLAGYLPRQRRESTLVAEAKAQSVALPVVTVAAVRRAASAGRLLLPGNIQAITEAPVLARTDGYLRRRHVDIGDRVAAGQLLAEIEAPELQQQIRQANAALDQARSSLEQAEAGVQQGKTNEELARITAERWANLVKRGVVSRQENDQYQAQYQAQTANVRALGKAVNAARSNVGAVDANLARLHEVESYQKVRAPFAGVITVRNVDVGALIASGSTLLFRIAQTHTLRAYVNVPQANTAAIKVGQRAVLTIPDLPGKQFEGTVARTANALDPASRTLLAEVMVPNPGGVLMPGMYAQVDLSSPRMEAPLVVPGDALVVRADGTQAAVVNPDGTVHFQRIDVGRDYGDRIEVRAGLEAGQLVVINPGDTAREGAKVNPVRGFEKPAKP